MRSQVRKNLKRIDSDAVSISSATTSSAITLTGRTVVGLDVSALTTATSCTFTVSTAVDGTYRTLTDKDGTDFTVTLAAGDWIYLDPAVFASVEFLKIVLNTSGSLTASLIHRNLE